MKPGRRTSSGGAAYLRYDMHLISKFNEESGEIGSWLVCVQCPNREGLRVK